jgi:two-component system sensor histidine kinase YesM
MYSLLNNNIDGGIRSNIKQIQISMNNVLSNLENAALQLAMYNGRVANDIEIYIDSTDLLKKYEKKQAVIESISLINAAKSELGLVFFYYADLNQVMFENQSVAPQFQLDNLPVLATGINATYYGPHMTARSVKDSMVFSIARKVNLIQGADLYVFMETGIKLFEDLLKSQQYKLSISYLLLNESGTVMYSQNEATFRSAPTSMWASWTARQSRIKSMITITSSARAASRDGTS